VFTTDEAGNPESKNVVVKIREKPMLTAFADVTKVRHTVASLLYFKHFKNTSYITYKILFVSSSSCRAALKPTVSIWFSASFEDVNRLSMTFPSVNR